MENNSIFQHLDSPTRFLYWTMDAVLIFLIPFLIGFFSGHVLIGTISSFVAFRFYRKVTSKFSSGFLQRFFYWHLPQISSKQLKSTPPSWIREYLG